MTCAYQLRPGSAPSTMIAVAVCPGSALAPRGYGRSCNGSETAGLAHRFSLGSRCAAGIAGCGEAAEHVQPGGRGAELLDHAGAPGDLRHAAVPGAARGRQRDEHRAGDRRPRPTTPSGSSPTTSAGTGRTAARATSGSTTGGRTATASCARSCSPRATARRSPATCGRRVAGPAKRPGIVITNGSVQADEQLYWYAAQALAKDGYVVLTFDPQGQGQSDTFGEGADQQRGRPRPERRPAVLRRHRGRDQLLPVDAAAPLRAGAELHHRDQPRRQAGPRGSSAGLDAAYNPFWQLLNPSEIGLAGHSYGAAGVSYIAQWDPRVKAVVAWDNLGGPDPKPARCPARQPADDRRAGLPGGSRRAHDRADHQARRSASRPTTGCRRRRTPRCPDPHGQGARSRWPTRKAGVDTRRADHPRRLAPGLQLHPQPGLRRLAARPGHDRLVHERLVRQVPQARPTADKRLLTQRWRNDPVERPSRPQPRPQRVLLLLPLAAGHPPVRRRDVRLRGHARGLPGDGRQRRLSRGLLLRRDRSFAGCGAVAD